MAGITGGGLVQLGYEPEVDFKLYDDGTGIVISEWNHSDPQPSVAEIEAAEIIFQQNIDARIAAQEAARQAIATKIGLTISELQEVDLLKVINELDEQEVVTTVNMIPSDNSLVYADGDQAARDVEGGWYYTNPGSPNKINWYVLSTDVTSNKVLTVEDMKTIWFDFRPRSDNSRIPYISIYTRFQGDGNDGGTWYRSRFNYELEPAPAWSPVLPGVYAPKLMYVGDNPNTHPNMEHLQLQYAGYASTGPQADDEIVQYVAISTDSSAAAGVYNFAVNNTGSEWVNGSITSILQGV